MFQQDVESWINGYLSEKVPEHNNLSRCPFAKKSLDQNRIYFEDANGSEEVYNIIEHYQSIWNEDNIDVVVIHLNWFTVPSEYARLCSICESYYGCTKSDNMFIHEHQLLNGRNYNMLLMHTYSDMQVAKRRLRKAGYFKESV